MMAGILVAGKQAVGTKRGGWRDRCVGISDRGSGTLDVSIQS